VAPDADMAALREGLHRRLWDLSPDLAAFVPDILPILGTAPERAAARAVTQTENRQERIQAAVVAWMTGECRRTPRLLVIEDVHWLDPSSEDLCRRLAAEARQVPLLMVMTSRVTLAGSRLELGGVRELALKALAAEDVHALIDAQIDPYPASDRLRRAIEERAQGNPFYVEELVRTLRERDSLRLERGAYDLRDPAGVVMSPSLHALIAARIDRLPRSAAELLADAAALGKRFPLAHLRALATTDRFEEDLAQLERRGLLDQEASGPIAVLVFHHVLTHEVAYGTLLQADRQARHRRAAETIESLYRGRTEEVRDQLAHHWARSDRAMAALPYLVDAAGGAVALGANREAIAHLQGALDLATAHPEAVSQRERDAIRLKLAGLHFVVGER
jgi:predicted ATPase